MSHCRLQDSGTGKRDNHHESENIACSFGDNTLTSLVKPQKDIYFVRDLAFYTMVLGREHSLGHWYYLCQLSISQFPKLLNAGEDWTYELLNNLEK